MVVFEKIMDIQQHTKVIRSQLLEMLRLSQRVVDYSIKSYELGSAELCGHVLNNEHKFCELRRAVEVRCRKLLVEGLPIDSDPGFVWSALRICSALHATYIAAAEIARNTLLSLESGQLLEPLTLKDMGQFVNRLVRLCTVALFKEEVQHAETVLQNQGIGRLFELIVYRPHSDIPRWMDTRSTFELAIMKSLGQISKQTHTMAGAITVWMESKSCLDVTGEERDRIVLPMARSFYAGESQ
jgi:hypothetical protein